MTMFSKLTDQEVNALHERCGDWQNGEKIFFSPKVDQGALSMNFDLIDDVCAESASFYAYQPRKKLVWLQFAKKDVKNPSRDRKDLIYPFTLRDVHYHNMRRTDV
jgi:hypothetical protein